MARARVRTCVREYMAASYTFTYSEDGPFREDDDERTNELTYVLTYIHTNRTLRRRPEEESVPIAMVTAGIALARPLVALRSTSAGFVRLRRRSYAPRPTGRQAAESAGQFNSARS